MGRGFRSTREFPTWPRTRAGAPVSPASAASTTIHPNSEEAGAAGPRPRRASPAGGAPIIRSPSVFASGPELKATVKWFNPEKGFGFVELGDGSGDAFLHVSVLQRVGADAVNPAPACGSASAPARRASRSPRCWRSPAPATPRRRGVAPRPAAAMAPAAAGGGFGGPRPPRRPGGGGGGFMPQGDAQEMRGTVKWYSAEKGFGFVSPDKRRPRRLRPCHRARAQRPHPPDRRPGGGDEGRAGQEGSGSGDADPGLIRRAGPAGGRSGDLHARLRIAFRPAPAAGGCGRRRDPPITVQGRSISAGEAAECCCGASGP